MFLFNCNFFVVKTAEIKNKVDEMERSENRNLKLSNIH